MNKVKYGNPETALAAFLECDVNDITKSKWNDDAFLIHEQEYLVLTDDEADTMCRNEILSSLWAFNAEFIAKHTKNGLSDRAIKALKKMKEELCEDANDIVEALIKNMNNFVSKAISADGRGHFLNRYDGNEIEQGEYFIYRID